MQVDLTDAGDRPLTPAGELDGIANFEAAIGGHGDDVLTSAEVDPPRFSYNIWMAGGAGDDRIRVLSRVRAYGGAGNDRLRGGPQNDTLVGGEGADVLRGFGGRDFLGAGSGSDRLRGGSGDDVLDAEERRSEDGPATDFADCGAGKRDRVARDPRDRVARCER